ncbi:MULTISPECIES: hypothetical protein [unclassified Mesorhizobium]|uniref:hypothetical protein n=1 Tax=unclassified Mesorhizobium TaxID=325217 RepID=UPI0015E28AED|nr:MULTISPECIES: hypothetical protein [unclassified Mesorhizobium]
MAATFWHLDLQHIQNRQQSKSSRFPLSAGEFLDAEICVVGYVCVGGWHVLEIG